MVCQLRMRWEWVPRAVVQPLWLLCCVAGGWQALPLHWRWAWKGWGCGSCPAQCASGQAAWLPRHSPAAPLAWRLPYHLRLLRLQAAPQLLPWCRRRQAGTGRLLPPPVEKSPCEEGQWMVQNSNGFTTS